MNQESFTKWQKFHRMGKFRFFIITILFYILIGNIVALITNLIHNHKIVFTLSGVIFPTAIWAIVGICYSSLLWKSNEAAYKKFLKSGLEKEKAEQK